MRGQHGFLSTAFASCRAPIGPTVDYCFDRGAAESNGAIFSMGSRDGVATVVVETHVRAPVELCFDLARSVELHVESAGRTGERAVAGTKQGLLGAGEWVTWEARHLGRRRRLTVRVTAFEPPRFFCDEQVSGPFARFRHDHFFEPEADGTLMKDVLDFESRFALLDRLLPAPYLRRFLVRRNEVIRRAARGR
jgi:ligand-binding SRPBCC domain-containing protein